MGYDRARLNHIPSEAALKPNQQTLYLQASRGKAMTKSSWNNTFRSYRDDGHHKAAGIKAPKDRNLELARAIVMSRDFKGSEPKKNGK